jgi:inorganic pyrophosphatase
VKVFIQNEAGSLTKHYHDEKSLELKRSAQVSRPYPFPYGFVLDTTAEDGCNVDCFVLTRRRLRTGETIECEPVALMEQFEDGLNDHNVIAVLAGDEYPFDDAARLALTDFVQHVFDHVPGKRVEVGKLLGRLEALEYCHRAGDSKIAQCQNRVKRIALGAESRSKRQK